MYKPLILTALAALAMLGMQACFYTGSSGPYTSSLPSVTTHTVCDTNGNNCLACDDNNSCERTDAQYGSSSRHSVCDADGNGAVLEVAKVVRRRDQNNVPLFKHPLCFRYGEMPLPNGI
jgi:hypothetical protein